MGILCSQRGSQPRGGSCTLVLDSKHRDHPWLRRGALDLPQLPEHALHPCRQHRQVLMESTALSTPGSPRQALCLPSQTLNQHH